MIQGFDSEAHVRGAKLHADLYLEPNLPRSDISVTGVYGPPPQDISEQMPSVMLCKLNACNKVPEIWGEYDT